MLDLSQNRRQENGPSLPAGGGAPFSSGCDSGAASTPLASSSFKGA